MDNLIVVLIVAAALFYVWRKWARPASKGCGSGCDTCKACHTPEPVSGKRVIMLRKAHD